MPDGCTLDTSRTPTDAEVRDKINFHPGSSPTTDGGCAVKHNEMFRVGDIVTTEAWGDVKFAITSFHASVVRIESIDKITKTVMALTIEEVPTDESLHLGTHENAPTKNPDVISPRLEVRSDR